MFGKVLDGRKCGSRVSPSGRVVKNLSAMARRPRRTKRTGFAGWRRAILAFDVAATLSLGLGARSARADGSTASGQGALGALDMTYEAPSPPTCPSQADVSRAIARRIEPTWLTRADVRRFTVRIVRTAGGDYAGRLDVEHAGRSRGREIRAATCAEVATALVVFIAIALDPVAAEAPDETQESLPEPSPGSDARSPQPPAASQTAEVAVPPAARALAPRRAAFVEGAGVVPSWTWSALADVVYLRVPESAWGARVGGQLARRLAGSSGLSLSPGVRVLWGFADFATFPERAGKVALRYQAAQVQGCMAFGLSSIGLSLTPCVGADFGTLESTARDLRQGAHAEATWRAANGSVRASWSILSWLAVELEVGAIVPFERPTFGLSQPTRVAYRPPPVLFATSAGIGLNAQFP